MILVINIIGYHNICQVWYLLKNQWTLNVALFWNSCNHWSPFISTNKCTEEQVGIPSLPEKYVTMWHISIVINFIKFDCQVSRIEKVGGASSKGENSYGIEVFCKVSFLNIFYPNPACMTLLPSSGTWWYWHQQTVIVDFIVKCYLLLAPLIKCLKMDSEIVKIIWKIVPYCLILWIFLLIKPKGGR